MRLDRYLVDSGMVKTRSKAVHLIRTGNIRVDGEVVTKQSKNVSPGAKVEALRSYDYVSRGGFKIEGAFNDFGLSCDKMAILDLGCSTGGFSDFFLQNGAMEVYAVDISKDIIHASLLKEPRLHFLGGLDATDNVALKARLGEKKFDIVSIDLSNVALEVILPGLVKYLKQEGVIVALFKPAYEGGKGAVNETETKRLMSLFEAKIGNSFSVVGTHMSRLKGGPKDRGSAEAFYLLRPKRA